MSRVELDEIQCRLKTAIQKHQCLVTKLQLQPQDVGLKQQLQHVQMEIMKMSNKQKMVVQNLRKDLIDRQIREIKDQDDSSQSISIEKSSTPPDETSTSSSPLRVPNYPSVNNSSSQQVKSKDDIPRTKSTPVTTPEKDTREQTPDKAKELKKKLDFMACIDLVPPDSVRDTPSKRSERKRKSTNNPNFAYGFELERRPRLSNILASEYFGARKSKPRTSVVRTDTVSTTSIISTSSAFKSITNQSQYNTKENTPNESLCQICGLCGQMIVCDTCNHCFHLLCLSPPLHSLPVGSWQCATCQDSSDHSETSSLTAVNTYISNKTSKEEEKRKLLKRSSELLQEKTQLENRTKQLNEIIARQGVKKQDLLEINVKAKQSVENLKNFVKLIQSS